MPPIKVLIACENALLGDALGALLRTQTGVRLLGQATSEHETLRKSVALGPQAVLLEPWATPGSGARTVRALRRLVPDTVVLALPGGGSLDRRALRAAGVHGCMPRDAGRTELLAALAALFPAAVPPAGFCPRIVLSRREREVLGGAAAAMTNQQIARGLGITTGTVKRHLYAAFRKLDAVSRLDAVTKAFAAGLISAPAPPEPSALSESSGAGTGEVEVDFDVPPDFRAPAVTRVKARAA